jgi:DnaJ domain
MALIKLATIRVAAAVAKTLTQKALQSDVGHQIIKAGADITADKASSFATKQFDFLKARAMATPTGQSAAKLMRGRVSMSALAQAAFSSAASSRRHPMFGSGEVPPATQQPSPPLPPRYAPHTAARPFTTGSTGTAPQPAKPGPQPQARPTPTARPTNAAPGAGRPAAEPSARPANGAASPTTPQRPPDFRAANAARRAASLKTPDQPEPTGASVAREAMGLKPGASWSDVLGFAEPPLDYKALASQLSKLGAQGTGADFTSMRLKLEEVEDSVKQAAARLETKFAGHPDLPAIKSVFGDAARVFTAELENCKSAIDQAEAKPAPRTATKRSASDNEALGRMGLRENASAEEILGVAPGFAKKDLSKAYRTRLLEYHPDKTSADKTLANGATRLITEAFQALR